MSNMFDAYKREINLLPVVLDMESKGVKVRDDISEYHDYWQGQLDYYEGVLNDVSGGAKPGTKAMFNALRSRGHIDESKIEYTAKGNPRYGREFIEKMVSDEKIRKALTMRSKLVKAIGTYIRPFFESAVKYNGRYYAYFNQVRSIDDRGTSTGRFSSNLQQLPKEVDSDELPNLRTMVVADDGDILIKRDFDGQELRVAAHYAEGRILEAYVDDPKLDVHTLVQKLIKEVTGVEICRRDAKTMNFLKLYRGGANLLAEKVGCTPSEARNLFRAYDEALPEFEALMKAVERQVRCGTKLRTWGGRLYDVEPPTRNKWGKVTENYYKLGNLLIQGSSADMSKEAMVRYYNHKDRKGRLVMVVHDELVVSVPEKYAKQEMKILKWAMDEIPGWDVPLSSEGAIGSNFGEMELYED